jgi:hypothetical protein
MNLSTQIGLVAFVIGSGLRLWGQGNYAHFAAGFLIGIAIVLLIGGVIKQRRRKNV